MKENPIDRSHPLFEYVHGFMHDQVCRHILSGGAPEVEEYLTFLLLDFLRTDKLFAIKDPSGQPLQSVIEMLGEADIRLNATSFQREREVHKHVGDFILFWTGVAPTSLNRLRAQNVDLGLSYLRQGQESYYVVSTFDHSPYEGDAPICR
ncbi:MAG: hypothetical protein ABUL72_06065, partial [Armatimonadota bacterium]